MFRKNIILLLYLIVLLTAFTVLAQVPNPPTGLTIGNKPNRFTLTTNTSGAGTGTVTGRGIACGTDCTQTFNPLTSVDLTANPNTGSAFGGWTGCESVDVNNVCTVVMTANTTVTASFDVGTELLSVTKSGSGIGTVTSAPAGINCGVTCSSSYDFNTAVVLTATPTPPSTFVDWSGHCTGTGVCNLTMTEAKNVNANFNLPPTQFALIVTKDGTGFGTVTSSPAGINCGATCSASFVADTVVTLSSAATGGSTFIGWSGSGCSGTGTCIVTMSQARAVTATFDSAPVAGCSTTINGDQASVVAALANSANTTICINDGSWTWANNGIIINRNVTIRSVNPCIGATWNETSVDGLPNVIPTSGYSSCPATITLDGPATPVHITESTAGPIIIRDLGFILGTVGQDLTAGFRVNGGSATARPFVFMQNRMISPTYTAPGKDGFRWLVNRGVMARNTFVWTLGGGSCESGGNFPVIFQHYGGPDGQNPPGPWNESPWFGDFDTPANTGRAASGEYKMYFEQNHTTDILLINDGDQPGGRLVARYNRIFRGSLHTHGDSSTSGGRYIEAYGNKFINDTSVPPGCTGSPNAFDNIRTRAGTHIIAHNEIPNIVGGTKSGSTNNKVIQWWQWNLRRPAGQFGCYGKFTGSDPSGLHNYPANYPAPYQVGWGFTAGATHHATATADDGSPTASFDREPSFLFGNTGTGNGNGSTTFGYDFPQIVNHTCAASGGGCDNPTGSDLECSTSNRDANTYIVRDRDYYAQVYTSPGVKGPGDGTSGVGYGTTAQRPATCSNGGGDPSGGAAGTTWKAPGYYSTTDQTLYWCVGGAWVKYWKAFQFPHPLVTP